MFERFTDRARRVVVLAQEEARLLDHDYIGTEHLVLGLMSESEGGVQSVAQQFELTLEGLRTDVESRVGRGGGAPASHIPFTPGAKKALEMSLRAALRLGHNFISAEHIMLGVLSQEAEMGAQLLVAQGPTIEQIREALEHNITEVPTLMSDDPLRSPRVGAVDCLHPDMALGWDSAQIPGPEPIGRRRVIIVRCRNCGVAVSVFDDPGGSGAPPAAN